MNNNINNNEQELNSFYGNKVASKYFDKLSKIKDGDKILKNYKNSITKSVQTGNPLYYVFDRNEFANSDYISIKKQMDEKFISLVALAESMGYRVKNKNDGPFIEEDYAGILLYIEITNEKETKNINIINYKKLRSRMAK